MEYVINATIEVEGRGGRTHAGNADDFWQEIIHIAGMRGIDIVGSCVPTRPLTVRLVNFLKFVWLSVRVSLS